MARVDNIRNVAVAGTGVMGPGIALSFARAGYAVWLWGRTEASVGRGQAGLDHDGQALVSFDLASQAEIDAARQRITLTTDLAAAGSQADLVVETIIENFAAKQALFRQLDAVCPPYTILTTDTSGLPITSVTSVVERGALAVGTHFWNPPYLMPLVEVVKGERTSQDTFDITCRVIESIGKRPVRVLKDLPGFLGNRLLHTLWREALALVEHGVASPEDVDLIARYTFGMRMPPAGIFDIMDIVGLDLIQSIHEYLFAELDRRTSPSPVTTQLIEEGRLGAKAGQGFYEWKPGDAQAWRDARDAEIVRHASRLLDRGLIHKPQP